MSEDDDQIKRISSNNEDDEYYYYVKAVPKAVVSGTNKQVKRFGGKDEKERLTKKRFAEEMDIDEELLD